MMNQTLENQNPFMKEQIVQLINDLNEKGIEQIFEYATFLKFRTQTGINEAKKNSDKLRALEAMKKLKGSGNGQLMAALLNERQKERLQNG
ncbi:hypothetical protein BGP_1684 [Beggiatoa sp. PS]|nr:hypothetical protein BGP_1684 [Beggiatoa sp. PS]